MSEAKQGAAFVIPDEQKLTYKVTPEPGKLMSAASIGKQLVAISGLLKACAKDEDPGSKWEVALTEIHTETDGSIVFDLAIARIRRASSPPEGT